jgi:hypothetical protein
MTATLKDFLLTQNLDSSAIQQATRYYIGVRTNDLSPSKMRAELLKSAGETGAVDVGLGHLEKNPLALDNACLAFLSTAWDQDEERSKIQDAFLEARGKLPVIEVGLLAIVAMYAMYLATTGGISKRTVQRLPDGTLNDVTEYHAPAGPLGMVIKLFKPGPPTS